MKMRTVIVKIASKATVLGKLVPHTTHMLMSYPTIGYTMSKLKDLSV